MDLEKKLNVLKDLAKLFNDNQVTWILGASCMLYLRGVVETFNDIDIMISEIDVIRVKRLLSDYYLKEYLPDEKYRTKTFLEYKINDVDVDIMAGFIILKDKKEHCFPLTKQSNFEIFMVDDVPIRLAPIKEWLTYYRLMDRKDKVHLLEKKTKY